MPAVRSTSQRLGFSRSSPEVRDVPGYREVLRVQLNRKKSLSLRERM